MRTHTAHTPSSVSFIWRIKWMEQDVDNRWPLPPPLPPSSRLDAKRKDAADTAVSVLRAKQQEFHGICFSCVCVWVSVAVCEWARASVNSKRKNVFSLEYIEVVDGILCGHFYCEMAFVHTAHTQTHPARARGCTTRLCVGRHDDHAFPMFNGRKHSMCRNGRCATNEQSKLRRGRRRRREES